MEYTNRPYSTPYRKKSKRPSLTIEVNGSLYGLIGPLETNSEDSYSSSERRSYSPPPIKRRGGTRAEYEQRFFAQRPKLSRKNLYQTELAFQGRAENGMPMIYSQEDSSDGTRSTTVLNQEEETQWPWHLQCQMNMNGQNGEKCVKSRPVQQKRIRQSKLDLSKMQHQSKKSTSRLPEKN